MHRCFAYLLVDGPPCRNYACIPLLLQSSRIFWPSPFNRKRSGPFGFGWLFAGDAPHELREVWFTSGRLCGRWALSTFTSKAFSARSLLTKSGDVYRPLLERLANCPQNTASDPTTLVATLVAFHFPWRFLGASRPSLAEGPLVSQPCVSGPVARSSRLTGKTAAWQL